jgi:predicted nucleic acid-binding protein
MVLSALRQRERDPNLVAWLRTVPESSLHLSVVAIGEIERGIAAIAPHDPAFAQRLTVWLDEILRGYTSRILPVNIATARRWGQLTAAHGHAGADLLMAATALEHGLAVVTRNTRHFAGTGVRLIDPFVAPAADS